MKPNGPRAEPTNPWGMTPAQVAAMDVLLRTGCNKLAARELGVSPRTVEVHIGGARCHIGAPNRLLAALQFARWRQGLAPVQTEFKPQPTKESP